MTKAEMKQKVSETLDESQALQFLYALIRMPSESGKPTFAQELVQMKLTDLGFSVEQFPCAVDAIKNLVDFCNFAGNDTFNPAIYNVVGTKQGVENHNALLLYAHIDSAVRTAVNPDFTTSIEGDRLYGLGSADDKSGIAMMVMAAQAVLKQNPSPKKNFVLMSTLGKRGSMGTLTAFVEKGYQADAALYLHPAETGHGFREIKNYSMGTVDVKINLTGKAGVFRDEVDDSEISAVTLGAMVIEALQQWEQERRQSHHFEAETYQGIPNTKLNFLDAHSKDLLREDALGFEITCRIVFGLEETVASVVTALNQFLKDYFKDHNWLTAHPPTITYGEIKATPASIAKDTPLIQTLEENITLVQGDMDFIYQYHASSDIRIPIVYANTPTVGIGPLCGGLNAHEEREWLSLSDYMDGIKIAANMIIDWCY